MGSIVVRLALLAPVVKRFNVQRCFICGGVDPSRRFPANREDFQ